MSQTSKDDVKNIKWIFEPQLSDDNYAYYSYEVLWDDGDRTIETAILSFGRKGYHEIKFLKKIDENFNAREFEEMAKGFADSITFQEGYRYSDYKSGDKTAAVGIGGFSCWHLGCQSFS